MIPYTHIYPQANGDCVEIVWDDGHISPFSVRWLQDRSFSRPAQTRRKTWYGVAAKQWDGAFNIPSLTYEKVAVYNFSTITHNFVILTVTVDKIIIRQLSTLHGLYVNHGLFPIDFKGKWD